jgi:hypothetical protein
MVEPWVHMCPIRAACGYRLERSLYLPASAFGYMKASAQPCPRKRPFRRWSLQPRSGQPAEPCEKDQFACFEGAGPFLRRRAVGVAGTGDTSRIGAALQHVLHLPCLGQARHTAPRLGKKRGSFPACAVHNQAVAKHAAMFALARSSRTWPQRRMTMRGQKQTRGMESDERLRHRRA